MIVCLVAVIGTIASSGNINILIFSSFKTYLGFGLRQNLTATSLLPITDFDFKAGLH